MNKCRCGGMLIPVYGKSNILLHYQCGTCNNTFDCNEINKQLCNKCNVQLYEYEKQIVLGEHLCHSCLIKKYITQNVKLKAYQNNPDKRISDARKKVSDALEIMQSNAESIIDEIVTLTLKEEW